MKKLILLLLLLSTGPLFAHYIWLETPSRGTLDTPQLVKVRFGEYTHGVLEKVTGKSFQSVKEFSLWLVDPKGNKTPLKVSPFDDYYRASFTPKITGTYTLVLDNKNMEVLDFTKHNYTIFKPQYHAKATVTVGNGNSNTKATNTTSIELVDHSTYSKNPQSELSLQVLFKGKPMKNQKVSIFAKDLWSKELTTDSHGKITCKLPWDTQYTVETTYEEKTPGTYKGKEYKLIWHCATFCIKK